MVAITGLSLASLGLTSAGWRIAKQETRLDQLFERIEAIDRQGEMFLREAGMALDYAIRVHFEFAEMGGPVRPLRRPTDDAWQRLQVEECGNLVSSNVMGSRRFMNVVRQRVRREAGENTDAPRDEGTGEAMESEEAAADDNEEPKLRFPDRAWLGGGLETKLHCRGYMIDLFKDAVRDKPCIHESLQAQMNSYMRNDGKSKTPRWCKLQAEGSRGSREHPWLAVNMGRSAAQPGSSLQGGVRMIFTSAHGNPSARMTQTQIENVYHHAFHHVPWTIHGGHFTRWGPFGWKVALPARAGQLTETAIISIRKQMNFPAIDFQNQVTELQISWMSNHLNSQFFPSGWLSLKISAIASCGRYVTWTKEGWLDGWREWVAKRIDK